jgi:hypothetical protein
MEIEMATDYLSWLEEQDDKLARDALKIIVSCNPNAHKTGLTNENHITCITDWLLDKASTCTAAGVAYSKIMEIAST